MRALLFAICVLYAPILFSQDGKITLLIDDFTYSGRLENKQWLAISGAEVSNAFIEYGGFSIVDRKYTKKIEQELERQKSESFIDGKTVEQGKAVGAEYIVAGHLDIEKWMLELRLVNVATQEVFEKQEGKLDIYGNASYYKKQAKRLVAQLASKLLKVENIPVVRILETKKETAQLLLIAGGSKKGFKEGQTLELYQIEVEQVDGEDFERFLPFGEAKIETVENANFSQAKVKKGGEIITKCLNGNKPVYCRIIE
jgi:hypothetical protein